MDRTTLVMFPLEAGKQLVDALNEDGFDVQAALWRYQEESDLWSLVIASTLVEKIGPKESYRRILSKLQSIRAALDPLLNDLYMNSITILSPRSSLIRGLKKVVHVGPGDPPIRLSRIPIEDNFVDEAYIYLML